MHVCFLIQDICSSLDVACSLDVCVRSRVSRGADLHKGKRMALAKGKPCCFVQFGWSCEEKVNREKCLLMHAAWATDSLRNGARQSDPGVQLSTWHVIVAVAVATGNMSDLSRVCTAGMALIPTQAEMFVSKTSFKKKSIRRFSSVLNKTNKKGLVEFRFSKRFPKIACDVLPF